MQINRCISCENEIQHYPCPHCGFDIAGYTQPEAALPVNTVLRGRYLIGKVLGQGGFGITYVGWDLALEIRVAIKEFYPRNQVSRSTASTKLNWYTNVQAATLQKSGMETFLKEARKMARVEKIPEVVRVRDTFAENETAYIVMDFVDGENLKDYLKNNGTLSWEKAQNIFFPVISAMEQVHNMGIIHRDLSPDNLMILPDGAVNILDLGAAKDLSVSSGLSSEVVAKAGFSPFEQYVQRGGSGTWTDVYAIAATIYYALTGKLPPAAPDRVNAVFDGKPDPIEWDLPQLKALPSNVLEALQNAMKVSAKERTQTMHELFEELKTEAASVVPPVNPPKAPTKKPPENPPVTPPADPPQEPILRCTVCNTPLDKRGRCPKCNSRKPKKWPWILVAVAAVILICLASGVHPHLWVPADCNTPSHCLLCGQTVGTAPGHRWVAATCTEPRHCSVCGAKVGPVEHKWVAATCTEAEHCSVCNVTRAPANGHHWIAATCTEAEYCSVCHETRTPAQGHQWVDATYTAPQTCKVCGTTVGHVKGYIEKLEYTYGDVLTEVSRTQGYPLILSQPVKNCIQMTLNFQITKVEYGSPYGRWALYGKDMNGTWKRLHYFDVLDGNPFEEIIEFGSPVSFSELFISNVSLASGARWYQSQSFTDIYTRE